MIEQEDPETVAAVFMEPVQNSGGTFTPPAGYYQGVREICYEYGILLVADEVICGFGRLGLLVRLGALRHPPRHRHVRQGHRLGARAAGRRAHDRRASRRRSSRAPTCSTTASPTAATRWHCAVGAEEPRGHGARAACSSNVRANEPYFQRAAGRAGRRSRSSATCAAPATSCRSSWSRTRTPSRPSTDDESEHLLRGFLSGRLYESGLICRADDRGDPVIQLSPPLIATSAPTWTTSMTCSTPCWTRPGPR